MPSDFAGLREREATAAESSADDSSRPRLTADGREQLRREACARYEAGIFLTFDEFVRKHEGR